jgi:UDP-2,4-diacetamido-2,4,6-trideoxy-beta-L-altropyranose hydrolase
MRCLVLAEALSARGWSCSFASNAEAPVDIPALARSDYRAIGVAVEDGTKALRDHWPEGCDLLVVDHYGLDQGFEAGLRPWAKQILVIDDLADRSHDTDYLLDQTLLRRGEAYAGLVPQHCQFFLGGGHALLRPQFRAARAAALQHRAGSQAVQRVLVAIGGVDGRGLTPLALRAIHDSGLDVTVDVIMGGQAPALPEVKKLIEELPLLIHLHVDTDQVASLMRRADLAIGAAGTSSAERCCLGLPTLAVTVADNQRGNALALEQAGAAHLLGWWQEVDEVSICAALQRLSGDAAKLRKMADAAATMIDGDGATRVAAAIAAKTGTEPREALKAGVVLQA